MPRFNSAARHYIDDTYVSHYPKLRPARSYEPTGSDIFCKILICTTASAAISIPVSVLVSPIFGIAAAAGAAWFIWESFVFG